MNEIQEEIVLVRVTRGSRFELARVQAIEGQLYIFPQFL